MHDGEKRIGSLEDAEIQFVDALYEIQRGYNLSESGIDQGGPDRYICSAETFNKFIEKLHGIHVDCRLLYMTKATASLKLPIVVREEVMRYLATFANTNMAETLLTFTRLIAQVKENGLKVIWVHIKDNIAKRMFDEFGSLYQDRTDPNFTMLVEASKEVELDDLSTFQEIAIQLDKLENKAKNLCDRDHILAYCKASNIVRLLCDLNHDYFTEKKIDSKTYKEKALDIINQERLVLDKHRGYKQILGNLLILIATLGMGQLVNKACTGNFLFFKTDSSKYIDKLSNMIEKMKFTCPSYKVFPSFLAK